MAGEINWGSVADWVSGLGSVAASITALYLARSSDRIQLEGSFGVRMLVGGRGPTRDLVSVRITNTGRRATIVSTLAIRTGRRFRKKRYAIIPLWDPGISHTLPTTLQDGDEAAWFIGLEDNDKWLRDLCSGDEPFVRTASDVETFCLEVHTRNGGMLALQAEKSLRERLMTALAATTAPA